MSGKGESQGGRTRPDRVIRKVVVTYHLEGETEERTFSLENEGAGEVIDGVVWSAALMNRMAYLEADGSGTPVPRRPGKGWRLRDTGPQRAISAAAASGEGEGEGGECIWVHSTSCQWHEFCP